MCPSEPPAAAISAKGRIAPPRPNAAALGREAGLLTAVGSGVDRSWEGAGFSPDRGCSSPTRPCGPSRIYAIADNMLTGGRMAG